jgi:hypothetical protein
VMLFRYEAYRGLTEPCSEVIRRGLPSDDMRLQGNQTRAQLTAPYLSDALINNERPAPKPLE